MAETSLLDTLKALQNISEDDILTSERIPEVELVTAVSPPSHLINRIEPDFIMGYDVDTTALWEAYVRGEQIIIAGPTGTGKSSLAYHLLDNANESVRRKNRITFAKNNSVLQKGGTEKDLLGYKPIPYEVSYLGCGVGTRIEAVIGTLKFRSTDTGREPYAVYGAVVDAWVNGKTLIIDELDFASPDIWGELHQFFDGRTNETTIYINGPEVIRKHPKFRVIATANTFGNGENQMEFSGTQLLNTAFLNRFSYKIELDYLKADKEVEAVLKHIGAMDTEALTKMVTIAGKIRTDKKAGVLTRGISTRDLKAWSRECVALDGRLSKNNLQHRKDIRSYWTAVVVPAAKATYLTGNPDGSVLGSYLEIH